MLADVLTFHSRDSLTLAEAGCLFGDPPLPGGVAGQKGERLIAAAASGDLETLDELAYAGARVSRAKLARYLVTFGTESDRRSHAFSWCMTPTTAPMKDVETSKPPAIVTAASKVAPLPVEASSFGASAPELQAMYLFGGAVTIARPHRK